MKIFYLLKYQLRLLKVKPTRYRALIQEVARNKSTSIVEVGVFNGRNSKRMIETAKAFHDPSKISYDGFDLFEMLSDSELKEEFSKMPLSESNIYDKLNPTGARIKLHKGYSQETLKEFISEKPAQPDFMFIDGGHSIDTVRSDWGYLSQLINKKTVVIFDDYYENTEEAILGKGCNELINELDPNKYKVEKLNPINEFAHDWGTLRVRFVKVTLK